MTIRQQSFYQDLLTDFFGQREQTRSKWRWKHDVESLGDLLCRLRRLELGLRLFLLGKKEKSISRSLIMELIEEEKGQSA